MQKDQSRELETCVVGCELLLDYREQLLLDRISLLQQRQVLLERRRDLLLLLEEYRTFLQHCKRWKPNVR